MRRMLVLVLAIGLPAAAAVSMTAQSAPQGAAPTPVTRADFERWKKELSNWGRWGNDDQIGALNLITPAKRRQAARSEETRLNSSHRIASRMPSSA